MTAQENAANVNKNLSSSLEKLSSGLRINKAADESSGMSIADKLRTQASALGQSISNANSANALVQIADKAMAEQSNILDIVKTKLIQASTQTTSDEGREAIRKDVSKLLEQLDNIAAQTNYNGINLLDAKGAEFSFQVGEDKSYDVSTTTAHAANTTGLGGGANTYTAGAQTLDANGAGLRVQADGSQSNGEGISIQSATTAGTSNFSVVGDNVESIVYTATAGSSMTFTTTDENLSNTLKSMASGTVGLSESNGTFTLTISTGASNVLLDFGGAKIDISSFNASSMEASTAGGLNGSIVVESDSALTVTKTDTSAGTIALDAADTNGTTVAADSGAMIGGDTLSALKNLDENGLTSDVANQFMSAIDEALNQINTVRSDFGSTQNQLDSFIRNAMTTQTNIKAAESVIRDVDYAAESANFNKQNIIAQAGTYAMSQANAVQQNVMRLLQ